MAIIIVSIIAMLIVFPLFWSSVIALIAFVGGWRQLSDAYPPEGSESAEWQHGCSAPQLVLGIIAPLCMSAKTRITST